MSKETYYTIKKAAVSHQDNITNALQHWFYNLCVKHYLDNSSTAERPLFDLSEEQIEEIKKGKQDE